MALVAPARRAFEWHRRAADAARRGVTLGVAVTHQVPVSAPSLDRASLKQAGAEPLVLRGR
jgi:hypothetical protein